MIQLLSRWLIHDRDNVSSPAVRRAYGTLCGAVGIALNILLFAGKFFAGQLSGSIAVTADAFNNPVSYTHLGLLHQLDDLGQGGVAAHAIGCQLQIAAGEDGLSLIHI